MTLARHSAPGGSAGFDYQFQRALYWLAKSPSGAVVGIETDDDVSVRHPDGSVSLEQDKHSIRAAGKPFGDRSQDLWKTLSIWVQAVDAGEVAPDTRFFMVTNKKLDDCIAVRVGSATSHEEVDACVVDLIAAATDASASIAPYVEHVLGEASQQNLRLVIQNCECIHGSGSLDGTLQAEVMTSLPLPSWCLSIAPSIFDELLGWLHNVVASMWQSNAPAWIKRDHFVNQLHAVLESRKLQRFRERAIHLIPIPEGAIGSEKESVFVKQLFLVSDDTSLVDTAIRDFIRCGIEKSRLSEEGNITDDEWLGFEAALIERWAKIRMRLTRTRKGHPDEDIGYEILTETTEQYLAKLAGLDTEQVYLTSGSYHRLANALSVGWHPEYVTGEAQLRPDERVAYRSVGAGLTWLRG